MSQALHTASTGINTGTQQINVIANNVANINTTAFKSANMTFETLYSRNLSYGSEATKSGGGTNPKQIGLGVKVGGITRNFVSGEYVSTGRDLDTMISGNGFYVVQDGNGEQFYTRDGIFSMDSNGNLVTQNGMRVVAAKSVYSNTSTDKTVRIPKNLSTKIIGDTNIQNKKLSELNNAGITSGNVTARIAGVDADGNPKSIDVTLTVPEGNPTVQEVMDSFNAAIKAKEAETGISTGAGFSASDGVIKSKGNIIYSEDGTTSNFLAQTGLANGNTSFIIAQQVVLQDMINYNDKNAVALKSATLDENGVIVATYKDGSVLTQYVDKSETIQWKYTAPDGVMITGSDVKAVGSSIANSEFVVELATMVNQEGLISINNNLWKWGPDVGEIFYGMAGEMSFGTIETGGYEGSNVDIAFELTNMISAQRMIQMNSRVFSTASSVMETLAYLGS